MNKSSLNLNEFKRCFVEKKLSKSEVARKFNISRRSVVRLMKKERINTEDAWTKNYDIKLNEFQKEVLYGTLLGDGCLFIYPTSKNPSLLMYHSISQKMYIQMKLNIFKDFVYNSKLKTAKRKKGKRVYFRTCCHEEFYPIYKDFYKDKTKIVTKKILDQLTPLSVAFWFMDDGSRCKNRGLAIHTNSFTLNEVEMICQWFYDKFDIITKPQKRKENQWVVFFSNKTSKEFVDIIIPYVCMSMRYKFKGIFFKNPQRLYAIPFVNEKLTGTEDIV